MKPIILTSALPYANGPIHIGHLVEYIQTDIIARYFRLMDSQIIYVCADDTHGAPIEINARKEGITPEQLVAKYNREHKEDFLQFNISFDSYHTTNSNENKLLADSIFTSLKQKNLIYTKPMMLTYCEHDRRFLPDRFVKGECPKCGAKDQYGDVCEHCGITYKPVDLIKPYCVLCSKSPVQKESINYFFKLSGFREQLKQWLSENKNLQPEVVNQVMQWVNTGLEDWCISRDGPYFGFKIPGEENKYYYVWLDAPIGYISSTAHYFNDDTKKALEHWSKSRIIHVIGKDIIYFHLLFWPAMLWGSGNQAPDTIIVHGHLTVNGEKMSKSRGTFLTAKDFLKIGNPEHLRFYYASSLARTMADFDLSLKEYADKVNNELIGNIANFCYRVLSFANAQMGSKLTHIEDTDAWAVWKERCRKTLEFYGKFELREAVKQLLAVSQAGNTYFQQHEPWKLMKEKPDDARAVVTLCANLVKNIAIIIKPILPAFAKRLEYQLEDCSIGKAEIVFTKIEEPKLASEDPFARLNLKIATILDVQNHPSADKLYVLQIDLGEKRQLCAGIKQFYNPEELKGKKIVVVSNLKPAKLRGVESQGMLLAAEKDGVVRVLAAPKSEPGDQVVVEGIGAGKAEITIDDFAQVTITTKGKVAVHAGKPLKTAHENIGADVGDGAKVR